MAYSPAMEIREHPTLIGYGASRDGRIWSRFIPGPGSRLSGEWQRQVKLRRHTNGYLQFNPTRHSYYAHIFVLECWAGPCPEGMVCRHLDGDPSNNALTNLAWGTHKENQADRITHGTDSRGVRCYAAKLSEDDVRAIREDSRTQVAIAAAYGISQPQVSRIKSRAKWGHV